MRTGASNRPRAPRWLTPFWLVPLVLAAVGAASVLVDECRNGGGTAIPRAELAGPEEVVFSTAKDSCESLDIPDNPIHAFRNAEGRVIAIASHFVVRALEGPSLNRLSHPCAVLLKSHSDPLPENFDDKEWIHSVYTPDGRTVYALISEEYHGWEHPGHCPFNATSPPSKWSKCWYNAITLGVSRDGGRSFQHAPPPRQLIASVPYQYVAGDGPYGIFSPTNVVHRQEDGYYYMMVRAEAYKAQAHGTCLLRTRNLGDPTSWRAWDGTDFRVQFVDPYLMQVENPEDHVCSPIAPKEIGAMSYSLTYNTYLKKYLLVGVANGIGVTRWGFYYSVSDDLIHWTDRRLLMAAELPWTWKCGDADTTLYASVLDPDSASRNFETADRDFYLYFSRYEYENCALTQQRELLRVPVRLSR
jgi:hypothetical protein